MKDSHFQFSISDPDETDLVIVSVTDTRTGYIVRTALPNSGKQTASIMAFAGARFSRSSLSAEELFQEIRQAGSNANEKLANIFRNYGHSSVADMAQIFAYIEQIPDHYSTIFFNETSVGGGQQRSTRYQNFGNSKPLGLDNLGIDTSSANYNEINQNLLDLQEYALDKYKYWQEKLTAEYTRVYAIDKNNKSETGALIARVFDSTRYFLPSGLMNKTSLAYITSAREWARLISIFKASNEYNLVCLAEQLEILFAPDDTEAKKLGYTPEAPDLIRHTEADTITNQNLNILQKYLEEHLQITQVLEFSNNITCHKIKADLLTMNLSAGSKILLQHIITIYPNASIQSIIQFIDKLNIEQKSYISKILFKDFNHHKQMGNLFRVNTHSFVLTCSNSELRDLNRHRAWGRYIPILNTTNYQNIIYTGYTLPLYLAKNPALKEIKQEFEQDLQEYYTRLQQFIASSSQYKWFPQYIYIQLLPFAHIFTSFFHASPKEISYMTQLRVRPGGHINYRQLAYDIAKLGANSESLLQAMIPDHIVKPDACSREEFIDRS
jgi:thymidylate synthase ThyX